MKAVESNRCPDEESRKLKRRVESRKKRYMCTAKPKMEKANDAMLAGPNISINPDYTPSKTKPRSRPNAVFMLFMLLMNPLLP